MRETGGTMDTILGLAAAIGLCYAGYMIWARKAAARVISRVMTSLQLWLNYDGRAEMNFACTTKRKRRVTPSIVK